MPPKKKKGKGSAAARKEGKPGQQAVAEPVSQDSKEFYLLQIRDLEGQVERYQRKWDEVSARENLLISQYTQVSSDKNEIVSFLKRTLDQRTDEILDLKDQLAGLQQAKDDERDAYVAQLSQLRHEFQKTKDHLTSENMMLAGKLASLEEFREQKEELMDKFAALEEKLRKQEEEHKDTMYKLDKKAVLDKDRLKKEMVQRVNSVADEFRRVSNSQMAETTKRTIRENVSIGSQLTKMSNRSLELMQENDHLKEQECELRKQLEMLEENEKELVKNNLSNKKVIRMLTEKCQKQEEMLDLAAQREHELNQLHMEYLSLQEEAQALRQRMSSLEEEVHRLGEEKDKANGQLEDEKNNRETVEMVLSQAAFVLKDILMEEPNDKLEDTEVLKLARRNQTLQKLLLLLNSAATLGLGPSLNDFQSRGAQNVENDMSPKSYRQMVSPALKGPGVIPHYRMGDLGLVPRQDVSNVLLSKVGKQSRNTRLGPIQAKPAIEKDLHMPRQEEKDRDQSTLPRILSIPASKTLLMAK
ncbi:cilia- and flagella-associated protein 157 [Pseudophryne corroboree]|uniref:cilia- and flagella-associated protein 157 n=1 Tax=Pseudophryne corroboree TaxID=495146 RepID=UPI0030814281